MTQMETECSDGKPGPLAARDALLSRLAGSPWPFGPLLDLLALPPASDLLDVGAGDGRLLGTLRSRGHRGKLLGLDPGPVPFPGVRRGVAEALPFPAASFDAVTFVRVLAHLADPAAALREAKRVLRPGGRVVLASHGAEHLRLLGGAPSGPGPEAPLKAALAALGWTTVRRDAQLPVTLTAADLAAWAGSYDGLDAPAGAAPVTATLHLAVFVARP